MNFDEFYIFLMKIKFKGLSINSGIKKLKNLKSWKSSLFSFFSNSLSVLELWKNITKNSDHSMRSPEAKIYILFLLPSPSVKLFLYCLIYFVRDLATFDISEKFLNKWYFKRICNPWHLRFFLFYGVWTQILKHVIVRST